MSYKQVHSKIQTNKSETERANRCPSKQTAGDKPFSRTWSRTKIVHISKLGKKTIQSARKPMLAK